MIRLDQLSIRNFRGIRELDLEFGGMNFAIQGPNGSGKSGVVDAIEFVLTGSITRLTGPGTGGLSTTRHGPHVDFRDKPRDSKVSLTATIIATGAKVTLERSPDKPKVIRLTPDEASTRAVIEQLAMHPEFVLSRREIIKYILVEAGKRATAIQSLLKLERVEQFRSALRTASNSLSRAKATSETARKTAHEALKRALRLGALSKDTVITEVNKLRTAAGLGPLDDLSPSVRVDSDARTDEKPKRETISRKVLLDDLKTLRQLFKEDRPETLASTVAEFAEKHKLLLADPALLRDVEAQQFLELGLQRFDGKACPFCGAAWEEEALRELVRQALARLAAGKALSALLSALGAEITSRAQTLDRPLRALAVAATQLKLTDESAALDETPSLPTCVRLRTTGGLL